MPQTGDCQEEVPAMSDATTHGGSVTVRVTRALATFCVAVVLPAILPASAATPAQQGMIRGKVRAPDGATVNNAIVELRLGGGGMISQTVTRNDGDFAFNGLVRGEYEVAVTLAGYLPVVQLVRFTEDDRALGSRDYDRMNFHETVTVEITIQPKAETNLLGPPGTSFVQDVPKPARASFEKAMGKLHDGKNEEGVVLLRDAIANFGDYFDAHFMLGRELFREGKENEALEELERARQINDRQDAVFFVFGLVMLKQQKFVIGEYAFRQASTLNPNNVGSHFYRALALIEIAVRTSDAKERDDALAEALTALNKAHELSSGRLSAVYYQRARIYEKQGDKLAAAKELESYLKAEPDAKNAVAIKSLIVKLRGEAR
jgi:Tfp pilus assembly protein PilF